MESLYRMNASSLSRLRRFFACLSVSLLAIGSASAASADKIYFTASTSSSATTDSLNRIDADGTNQTVLAADTANFLSPDMCAVDSTAGFVWVADGAGSFKLIRYDLNGTLASRTVIYTANTNQLVRGVMVHTASQKLYVITNSGTAADDRLIRMNYDGTGAQDLAAGATHFQQPAFGCIDPVRGYVYVADNLINSTSAGLLRYNLDGTGRTQVKTWTELNPNPGTITSMSIQGVAVDRSTGQIYVVTASNTAAAADRVLRMEADFSGLVELMAGSAHFNQPVSIHVDRGRNRLLVGDLGATTAVNIFAFDLNGGNKTTFTTVTATAGIGYTAGIALHSLTAPAISDVVNQNVAMNGNTGALAVTINDLETPLANLVLYGTSSNTTLVPNANIVAGGSGGTRTITVTPAAGQTGSATITLYVDDGQRQTTDTFTVNVTAPSNNADLAALTTTASGFAPTFAAGTTAYTANVPNATTSVTVTATRAEANATLAVQVNGGGYTALTSGSASGALSLNVGANPINVRVTAQDGTTIKTYTITVTRAGVPEIRITGNGTEITSGDITPSFGDDTRFLNTAISATSTRVYTIQNTGSGVLNLTGGTRFAVSGPHAAEFAVVAQPPATIAAGSSTTVTVNFTPAAAGTRTATVTVASDDADEASSTFAIDGNGINLTDANLSALTTTASGLAPVFGANTLAYTASVPNATTSTTVTATKSEAFASLQVRVNGGSFTSLTSGVASSALALNIGSNPIDVRVTAPDSVTTKTYTISVTRRSIIEDWRLGFFSDASGTANRANGADFDLDGKTNLLEFAFGTDPTAGNSGPSDLTMTGTYAAATFGTTGQPTVKLEPITNGVDFRALFIRRVDHAAAGLTYTPEFSADDFGSFTASVAVPTVLATSGSFQLVSVPYPHFLPNGKKARYFRVTVNITP